SRLGALLRRLGQLRSPSTCSSSAKKRDPVVPAYDSSRVWMSVTAPHDGRGRPRDSGRPADRRRAGLWSPKRRRSTVLPRGGYAGGMPRVGARPEPGNARRRAAPTSTRGGRSAPSAGLIGGGVVAGAIAGTVLLL